MRIVDIGMQIEIVFPFFAQDVVFPSITICNLNQVEASFLKSLNVYGNITLTNLLMDHFIGGHNENINQDDKLFINKTIETLGIDSSTTFLSKSRQKCQNLFISLSFQGKQLKWRHINDLTMGPMHYPTDFGSCCLLVPHIDFEPFQTHLTLGQHIPMNYSG